MRTEAWTSSPTTTVRGGAPKRPSDSTSQPARAQQRMAGGGQGGEVRHGSPGDHRAAGAFRQAKHLACPFERNLFQGDGRGRLHKKRCILIPGAHHPTGGERGGQTTAVHETEEAASGFGNGGRRSVLLEQIEHFFARAGTLRQQLAQNIESGHGCREGATERASS